MDSGSYGYTPGGACGFGPIRGDVDLDDTLGVDRGGERTAADISR